MKRLFFLLFLFLMLCIGISVAYLFSTQRKPEMISTIQKKILVIPTNTPSIPPTPTDIPFSIHVSGFPQTITENDIATFTWNIQAKNQTIHTTTIYLGNKSTPGILTINAVPEETAYTRAIPDFMNGNFEIPLQFVGNTSQLTPGIYYFRAYARIGEKHLWSDEQSFLVTPSETHHITIVDIPSEIYRNQNIALTWDISGIQAQTSYTTIAVSKQTQDSPKYTTPITSTSYTPVITDFTHGMTSIPLRFIGNTSFSEAGTYYIRAYAVINGKYIWSDEHTIIVHE